MFAERLNELLAALGLSTSGDVAAVLGCDRSYVSRMRTGARVPLLGRNSDRRLTKPLLAYAEEKGLLPQVAALCGGVSREDLAAWLWEGWAAPERTNSRLKATRKRRLAAGHKFGERLSALMEMAGLNNARPSRLANVDASLLSRYRRGLRAPEQNSKIVEVLSSVLLDRILAKEGPEALCLLLGAEELHGREEALELILAWLYTVQEEENGRIEAFLNDVHHFDPHLSLPFLPPEQAVDRALLAEDTPVYRGQEGLRRAVLRFLSEAVANRSPALWLYSDQDMSWMTGEAAYALRWRSLMLACVRQGTHIRIVHTVDRGLKELLDAIRSWMPLYMSGLVESYSSTRPRGSRFTHTLFLAPGTAAVSGFFPAGQEREDARYRYETTPEALEAAGDLYRALLRSSRPLFRISAAAEPSEAGARLFRPRAVPGVEVEVGEKSVTVRHLEAPALCFTVTHPVMREAFSAYADREEDEELIGKEETE